MGCGVWVAGTVFERTFKKEEGGEAMVLSLKTTKDEGGEVPETEEGKRQDGELDKIKSFLETLT